MAGDQLSAGYDVVVPQHLGRLPFVEELDRLARRTGVPFVEAMLTCPVRTRSLAPRHAPEPRCVPSTRTPPACCRAPVAGGAGRDAERLDQLQQARPRTRLVAVRPDDVAGTYALLPGVIGDDDGGFETSAIPISPKLETTGWTVRV